MVTDVQGSLLNVLPSFDVNSQNFSSRVGLRGYLKKRRRVGENSSVETKSS